MAVTLGGMVIEVRLLHRENAEPPMAVTLGGMAIEARLSHQENASLPIEVTLGGMAIDVRPLHPLFLQVVLYQRLALITVEKCQRGF